MNIIKVLINVDNIITQIKHEIKNYHLKRDSFISHVVCFYFS